MHPALLHPPVALHICSTSQLELMYSEHDSFALIRRSITLGTPAADRPGSHSLISALVSGMPDADGDADEITLLDKLRDPPSARFY
jgi:hypothetical protein